MNFKKWVTPAVLVIAGVIVVSVFVFRSRTRRASAGVEWESIHPVSSPDPVGAALKPAQTETPAPHLVVEPTQASPRDLEQMQVLDDILNSKNDNDPRLDSEFRNLSPTAKHLMEERYRALAPEKRNERGTIAFLIGREISSADDVAFMGSILKEPPCLSLADCTKAQDAGNPGSEHDEVGVNVTLNYPQLVTLHSIEEQIQQAEAGKKLPYLDNIRRILNDAANSPVSIVSEKAQDLQKRLRNLRS